MQRWEIYWIKFLLDESKLKSPNERTDKDYTRRPGLFWGDDGSYYQFIKFTTTAPRDKTEYKIINWKDAGLTSPTTIRCKKVDSVRIRDAENLVFAKIGKLSDEDIQKIKSQRLLVEFVEKEPKHIEHSLSEDEMKEIICSMITKYDASEEETFDELQSTVPTIPRDLVHRLYQMCSDNKTESLEENIFSFEEVWEELDNMED